jgi:hypothetical protein
LQLARELELVLLLARPPMVSRGFEPREPESGAGQTNE